MIRGLRTEDTASEAAFAASATHAQHDALVEQYRDGEYRFIVARAVQRCVAAFLHEPCPDGSLFIAAPGPDRATEVLTLDYYPRHGVYSSGIARASFGSIEYMEAQGMILDTESWRKHLNYTGVSFDPYAAPSNVRSLVQLCGRLPIPLVTELPIQILELQRHFLVLRWTPHAPPPRAHLWDSEWRQLQRTHGLYFPTEMCTKKIGPERGVLLIAWGRLRQYFHQVRREKWLAYQVAHRGFHRKLALGWLSWRGGAAEIAHEKYILASVMRHMIHAELSRIWSMWSHAAAGWRLGNVALKAAQSWWVEHKLSVCFLSWHGRCSI